MWEPKVGGRAEGASSPDGPGAGHFSSRPPRGSVRLASGGPGSVGWTVTSPTACDRQSPFSSSHSSGGDLTSLRDTSTLGMPPLSGALGGVLLAREGLHDHQVDDHHDDQAEDRPRD